MDINQAFPSKYLKQSDIPQPKTVTIATVTMENVAMDNQPAEMKVVIHFHGAEKGMIANKTNCNILAALYGP